MTTNINVSIIEASHEFDKAKSKLIEVIRKSNLKDSEKLDLLMQRGLYGIWTEIPAVFDDTPYYHEFVKELVLKYGDKSEFINITCYLEQVCLVKYEVVEINKIMSDIKEDKVILFETEYSDILEISKEEFGKILYKWCHDNQVGGFIFA